MSQENRIAMLIQYLADDPGDAFSKYALALEYIKQGKDDLAKEQMQELYACTPDYLPNYYHYGKLIAREGNTGMAIEIFEKGKSLAQLQGNNHTLNELNGAIEELT